VYQALFFAVPTALFVTIFLGYTLFFAVPTALFGTIILVVSALLDVESVFCVQVGVEFREDVSPFVIQAL
jgi:hypothetical protein